MRHEVRACSRFRSRWIRCSCAVEASYCERARSSESERPRSCPITCCASARFDADRRVGERWDCRHKGDADPRENVRRLPQPTYDKPLIGAGTGAPGGAGTSRVQEASRLSGRPSTGYLPKSWQNTRNSGSEGEFLPGTWYGPAPCLGRHKRRDGASCRSPPSPWSSLRRLHSASPGRPSLPRRCAPRTPRLESRSRSAALELYSLDERVVRWRRPGYARLQRDAASLQAERADLRQALAVARRGNRIAQRQLAARLRLMYEQGEVEPLEIIFGSKTLDEALASIDNLSRMSGPGRGRAASDRSRPHDSRRRQRPARGAPGRDRRCAGRAPGRPPTRCSRRVPSAGPTSRRWRPSAG